MNDLQVVMQSFSAIEQILIVISFLFGMTLLTALEDLTLGYMFLALVCVFVPILFAFAMFA